MILILFLFVCVISNSWAKPTILNYQDSIGQYSFGYSIPGSSRSEYRSSDGLTRGTYSYTDKNGAVQAVQYEAGQNLGFQIKASSLPEQAKPVQDTPEVLAAREQHLKLLHEASQNTDEGQSTIVETIQPETVVEIKESTLPAENSQVLPDAALPIVPIESRNLPTTEDKLISEKIETESRANPDSLVASENVPIITQESVTYTPEVLAAREAHFQAHETAAKLAAESDEKPLEQDESSIAQDEKSVELKSESSQQAETIPQDALKESKPQSMYGNEQPINSMYQSTQEKRDMPQDAQKIETMTQYAQAITSMPESAATKDEIQQYAQKIEPMPQYAQKIESMPQYEQKTEPMPQYVEAMASLPQYEGKKDEIGQYAQTMEPMYQNSQRMESMPQYAQTMESMPQYAKKTEPMPQNEQAMSTMYAQEIKYMPQISQRAESIPQYAQDMALMPQDTLKKEIMPQLAEKKDEQRTESMPQYVQNMESMPQYAQKTEPMPQYAQAMASMPQYAGQKVSGLAPASRLFRIMDARLPALNEFQQTKLKAGGYAAPIEVSHVAPTNVIPLLYPSYLGSSAFHYVYL